MSEQNTSAPFIGATPPPDPISPETGETRTITEVDLAANPGLDEHAGVGDTVELGPIVDPVTGTEVTFPDEEGEAEETPKAPSEEEAPAVAAEAAEAADTDEDILRKVAKAAYAESGGVDYEQLHPLAKDKLVQDAKYFRDNPQASADQWWEHEQRRTGAKGGFFELPQAQQERIEAFAASVKNAYHPKSSE